jgi:hypothetical protein
MVIKIPWKSANVPANVPVIVHMNRNILAKNERGVKSLLEAVA